MYIYTHVRYISIYIYKLCVYIYIYISKYTYILGCTRVQPRLNPVLYEIPEIAVPTDPCDATLRSAILYTCHATNLIRYDGLNLARVMGSLNETGNDLFSFLHSSSLFLFSSLLFCSSRVSRGRFSCEHSTPSRLSIIGPTNRNSNFYLPFLYIRFDKPSSTSYVPSAILLPFTYYP